MVSICTWAVKRLDLTAHNAPAYSFGNSHRFEGRKVMKTANLDSYDLHQSFIAPGPVPHQTQVMKEETIASRISLKQHRQMNGVLHRIRYSEKAAKMNPRQARWVSTSSTLQIMDTKQISSSYMAWEVPADGHGRRTRIRSSSGPSHFSHWSLSSVLQEL